jgi:hypothetical protein
MRPTFSGLMPRRIIAWMLLCRYKFVLLLLFVGYQLPTEAQNISILHDSISFHTLQDSFCACVNRHAGEESKDWGDALALGLFLKLDNRTAEYRKAEWLLRKTFVSTSMSRLDFLLDSLIINDGFGKCVTLWPVLLKDRAGFFGTIAMMRQNPPFLQLQTIHLREEVGQNLLTFIQQGVSDTLSILFERQSEFDSIRSSLLFLSKEIQGKVVTPEMKFERLGKDSSGICKMKLLRDGRYDMGGVRLIYRREDPYAKIGQIGMLLRDPIRKEDEAGSVQPGTPKK